MFRRTALFVIGLTAIACTTETWIYQPTDELTVAVEADDTELLGEAVLTYTSANLPSDETDVSNALRMTVTAEAGRR